MVVAKGHILLVHHHRIGAWVPPGGHIEADEMPEETVVREILEETGVQVEVMSTPQIETGDPEAFFLSAPLYIQSVLAIEKGERFYHLDLAYLCRPSSANAVDAQGLPLLCSSAEVKESRWVPIASVADIPLAKNVKEALDMLDSDAFSRFTHLAWH